MTLKPSGHNSQTGNPAADLYRINVLQNEAEFARFIEIIKSENVRSYLEIGAKYGGSLWRVARAMPAGSSVVAIDMPGGTVEWSKSSDSLQACAKELKRLHYGATLIWGDSTAADTVRTAKLLGPFDCVFIDANHTALFVNADWKNYGPMARIVAFHDIGWQRGPDFSGVQIDVPHFWDSIKGDYRHEEIKLDAKGKDNGIGVLWR